MSWNNVTKPTTSWSDGMGYLLTQALGFLLLENGGKIILDQSFNYKPSTTWTNISK